MQMHTCTFDVVDPLKICVRLCMCVCVCCVCVCVCKYTQKCKYIRVRTIMYYVQTQIYVYITGDIADMNQLICMMQVRVCACACECLYYMCGVFWEVWVCV